MIVKFLEDYRQGLRVYKEGDTAEFDNDMGRRLIKQDVATIVNEPSENMAINSDYIENRSKVYE